jgi:UDP-2,3-diacylglucosamine pyrophosphatase LpxH
MLQRAMLRAYVPKAEVKALFRAKVPGIMARLQAAESIARNIKLIRKSFYSISGGALVREYRKNLVIMKLISHALFRLEKEGLIKVYPNKIYYIPQKFIEGRDGEESINVFDTIAVTVEQVVRIFEGELVKKGAQEIREMCKPIFVPVKNLNEAEKLESERGRSLEEIVDWSPLTKLAAKDIAAGGYLYDMNKEVFEKRAVDLLTPSVYGRIDTTARKVASELDRYLDDQIQAAKECSGRDLWHFFSLGGADRLPLFSELREPDSLASVADLSELPASEAGQYLEAISEYSRESTKVAPTFDMTYIISDLHLQDYPHRDTFELLRLIQTVVVTEGTLVINGDFIDDWRAKSLDSIIANNKLIFDALRKVKRLVIVKGNHDSLFESFSGQRLFSENISVVDRFYDSAAGIHIEHGNFYDKFNSEASWIGKMATKAVNGIERNKTVGPQSLAWLEWFGRKFRSNDAWKRSKVNRVFKGIKDVYEHRDPDGTIFSREKPLNIVFGHYHFPGLFDAYGEINKMIENDPELSGKVRFFLTDSWYNSEGYAGQVAVFARKRGPGRKNLLATTFLWEYITARKIMTLYGYLDFKPGCQPG